MPKGNLSRLFLPPPFWPNKPQTVARAEYVHASDISIPVDEVASDPWVDIPSSFVDARIRHKLDNLVELVGVNAVSERRGVERTYNFSEGTMLGFRIGEKFYDYDDPYVTESELRRACTGQLIKNSQGRSVIWLETAGVMESGYGAQGTVNLSNLTSATGGFTYGFSAGSVLRFRTSQAFAIGSEDNRKKLVASQKFFIPKTAAEAKLMPMSSEIEITGQGKVSNDLNFNLMAGPNVAMATAGVGLDIESRSSVSGEFSLNVTALDGYRKVRVTIRALDSETQSFAAYLRAGLIFAPNSLQPPWGAGLLKYLVASLGYKTIEDLVNAYTTFTARYMYSLSRKGVIVASYDFDLNNPAAIPAYEEMIKLSTARAHALSRVYGLTGVAKVLAKETETTSSSLFDLTLLGEKLYLRKTLTTERTGGLEKNHKETMIYRDSIYAKERESCFTGKKEIEWQAVSIRDKTGENKPYFRFHFKKSEYGASTGETDEYFRFAQSMGIYANELTENLPQNLSEYDHILSNAEEIDTEIDIYFTQAGAKLIDEADKIKAYNAYLEASGEILPHYRNLPFLGPDMSSLKARDLIRTHRLIKTNKQSEEHRKREMVRIQREYKSLTQRDLVKDVKLVIDAEEFADSIAELTNVTDHEQAKKFFHKFGKEKGFNFMQTISALQKLAHPDNTLIHSLSRAGGGIILQSRDEGTIGHPREMVMDVLTRAV